MLFATLFPSLLLSMADAMVPQASAPSSVVVEQPRVTEARPDPLPVSEDVGSADFDALCGDVTVEMVGSTRRITEAQLDGCARLGVPVINEVQLGLNGLILAQAVGAQGFGVDLRELFLASAAYVPQDDACTLLPNPNQSWSDVAEDLPERPIRIYSQAGNPNIFIEMVLIEGARQIECLAELERRDPQAFERAVLPRRDAVWLETDGDEAALAQALADARDAVGLFGWQGFSGLQGVQAMPLGGILPTAATLGQGLYPAARPQYLYTTPEALNDPQVRSIITRLQGPSGSRPVRVYSTTGGNEISSVEETAKSRVRVYRSPD